MNFQFQGDGAEKAGVNKIIRVLKCDTFNTFNIINVYILSFKVILIITQKNSQEGKSRPYPRHYLHTFKNP